MNREEIVSALRRDGIEVGHAVLEEVKLELLEVHAELVANIDEDAVRGRTAGCPGANEHLHADDAEAKALARADALASLCEWVDRAIAGDAGSLNPFLVDRLCTVLGVP